MTQTMRRSHTDPELLYELTTLVRETTQAFFEATSREDVESIVRDRFRESVSERRTSSMSGHHRSGMNSWYSSRRIPDVSPRVGGT